MYRRSAGVVVPTLFEAASFPIWEAFQRGLPVACSNVTSLPEQVGRRPLVFDPHDTDAIAQAMTHPVAGRCGCARCGWSWARGRVASFTWRRTAEGFAALYRRLGGRPLQPGDEQRLAAEDLNRHTEASDAEEVPDRRRVTGDHVDQHLVGHGRQHLRVVTLVGQRASASRAVRTRVLT